MLTRCVEYLICPSRWQKCVVLVAAGVDVSTFSVNVNSHLHPIQVHFYISVSEPCQYFHDKQLNITAIFCHTHGTSWFSQTAPWASFTSSGACQPGFLSLGLLTMTQPAVALLSSSRLQVRTLRCLMALVLLKQTTDLYQL